MRLIVMLLSAFIVFSSYSAADAATKPNAEIQKYLDDLLVEAKKLDASVNGFSAEAGRKLYEFKRMHSEKNEKRGCTTCHTANPAGKGKTPVGKVIEPVSPAVNSERFTEKKKVEKWFKRNCKWVLERECTPREKGDYITYMFSL